MNWYLKVIQQYFDFSGRARRKEFWMFYLINMIISWGLSLFDLILGTDFFSVVSFIYSLFILIPNLAVSVRRLHDVGKTGWYMLLIFLPIIGWIWLLILWCMEGESRSNAWGDNPKGIGNDQFINQIGTE